MDDLWACPSCHSLNVRSARRCYKCKEKRPTAAGANATAAAATPDVAAPAPEKPAAATTTPAPKKRRVIGRSAKSVAEASAATTTASPEVTAAPAEPADEPAPIEPAAEPAPLEPADEPALIEQAAEPAPLGVDEPALIEQAAEPAPLDVVDEAAPLAATNEASSADEVDEAAPLEAMAEPDPVELPDDAAPLEATDEAVEAETTDQSDEVDAAARLATVAGAAPEVEVTPAAARAQATPRPATVLPPVDCVACGTPIFTSDRYCASCGHRVGAPLAASGAVGASAFAARPVWPRDMATPIAPASRSSRLPFRPVAAILTGIALFAFGVFIGLEVLTPKPITAGRGTDVTLPTPSPTPIVHTFTVNVAIDESRGSHEDTLGTIAMGAPCEPSAGTFPDVRPGTPVLVADQAGTILAKASLSEGRKSGVSTCAFRAHASVPEATFYRIGIGDRTASVISIDELSHGGWTTDVRFVVTP